MKHIKYFESKNDYYNGKFYPGGINGAHIGDYAILNPKNVTDWCYTLFGKIGKIVDIDDDAPGNCFKIFFSEIDSELVDQPKYWFFDYELLHYGTLEEMKICLDAEKYNL